MKSIRVNKEDGLARKCPSNCEKCGPIHGRNKITIDKLLGKVYTKTNSCRGFAYVTPCFLPFALKGPEAGGRQGLEQK